MAEDGWVDYQPDQPAAPSPQDGWVDYQPTQTPEPVQAQAAPSQDGWVDYQEPEAEGMLATGLRSFAHEAPAVVAGAAGAMYGAGIGAVTPIPGGALIGGIGGALAGGFGGSAVAEQGLKLMGADDSVQRAINQKANPWSSAIGQGAAQVLGFGAGAASTAARLGGAGIGAGIEAGSQLYQGEFDPARLATQTAAGAAFTNPYKWGTRIEEAGAKAAGALATRYHGRATSESGSIPAEPIPPNKNAEPPNPQNAPTTTPGADGEYAKPVRPQVESEGVIVGEDPTLKAAMDEAIGGVKPPVAEAPQGRPMEERPAPPEMAAQAQPGEAIRGPEPAAPVAEPVAEPPAKLSIVKDGDRHLLMRGDELVQGYPNRGAALRGKAAAERQQAAVEASPALNAEVAEALARPPVEPQPKAGGGGQEPPLPPQTPAVASPGAPPPESPATPPRAAGAKDLEEGLWPTIQRFFMPGSRSESGKAGLAAYREGYGTTEQMKQSAQARFTNDLYRADTTYSNLSPLEQRKLDNYAEGGEHLKTAGHELHDPTYQPPAELKPVLDATRKGYEQVKAELQALPQHEQTEFIQNYLPHMYENTEQAAKFASDWYGSPSGSVKQRSHPTQEDAIKAGLVPKAISPIDRFIRYSDSISKYISDKKTLNKLNEDGWLHWTKPQTVGASGAPEPLVKGAAPEGYMKLEMPGAVDKMGRQAYAPRDMAETLNNLYSAGLRRTKTAGNIYDFALQTKNMWTAAELGLSPYHAFTMVGETFGSNYARAISEMSSGRLDQAGKTLARSFVSPVVDAIHGKRMIDVYTGKAKNVTPQEQTIVDALKKANIKPIGLEHVGDAETVSKLGSYARSYMRGTLQKEFKAAGKEIFGGNWKEGAMFVPNQVARLMQTAMDPLFRHYIPAMKMAMASRDMASFLHANPRATTDELAAVGRRTADSMDNRFGEMVKDNLSMNKAFKDGAFAAMRSFAFTIGGPIREIAGGARSGIAGALKGENRLNMTSKAYDPRVGYALAFPLVTMGMASIAQYAMTGTWPTDWKDAVVPKTGGLIKSGKSEVEERVLLPGYHKDFLGYAYHPTQELWAKMAGPWQALYEQISGKDYKDQPFIPPKASWPEQFKYRGEALLNKMTPIAMQSLQEKNAPPEGSKIPIAARLAGFRSPGSYLQNPNYERGKEQREFKDWRKREIQTNRDRVNRGLEPLPARPRSTP